MFSKELAIKGSQIIIVLFIIINALFNAAIFLSYVELTITNTSAQLSINQQVSKCCMLKSCKVPRHEVYVTFTTFHALNTAIFLITDFNPLPCFSNRMPESSLGKTVYSRLRFGTISFTFKPMLTCAEVT